MTDGSSQKSLRGLTFLVFGGLWAVVINQLRVEWSVNAQYSYGWVVPVLSLYLFWKRWITKPLPQPSSFSSLKYVILILALGFLPIRLIQEATPDWRLVSWAITCLAVAVSLCALFFAGGRPWLKHFFFPIFFMLTSVPWPTPLENRLVQTLMIGDATLVVEMVKWFGIFAVQRGNVIQTNAGLVGVDEACSGVRSLQTTIMIALFLGELYRLGILRRLSLLVAGLVVAFIWNVIRTFILVWISAKQGTAALTGWHDSAGFTVLGLTLVSLWILGKLFSLKNSKFSEGINPEPILTEKLESRRARFLPRPVLVGLLILAVVVETGTEFWYRSVESNTVKNKSWSVQWPTERRHFRETEISDVAQAMLRYNKGRGASWFEKDGTHWSMFFFQWFPGRTATILARSHRPELCLPASGFQLEEDSGVHFFQVKGLSLPFRSYIFTQQGKPVYVFYCVWEDRPSRTSSGTDQLLVSNRWDAIKNRHRNLGQQVLEIAIWGINSQTEAETALRLQLEQIIQI